MVVVVLQTIPRMGKVVMCRLRERGGRDNRKAIMGQVGSYLGVCKQESSPVGVVCMQVRKGVRNFFDRRNHNIIDFYQPSTTNA